MKIRKLILGAIIFAFVLGGRLIYVCDSGKDRHHTSFRIARNEEREIGDTDYPTREDPSPYREERSDENVDPSWYKLRDDYRKFYRMSPKAAEKFLIDSMNDANLSVSEQNKLLRWFHE